MASSQVEIASSSPFGYVLRDRNHRDGCRENNVSFQRNIKSFVIDHLNTCMSISSSDGSSTTNENNNNVAGSWVSTAATAKNKTNNLARLRFTRSNHNHNNKKKDKDESSSLASLISPRHSRLLDRWAARQAREMVSTLENEAELLSIDNNNNNNDNDDDANNNNNNMSARTSSSTSDECSSNLGASSLVQIWEKRLNKSNSSKPNTPVERTSATSCNNNNENEFSVVEEHRESEAGECCFERPSSSSSSSGNEEPFPDWESEDKTTHSDQSRWGSSESDRVSVADIIKKLTATTQNQSPPPSFWDDNDHIEGCCGSTSSVASSPCRDRDGGGFTPERTEHRALPQVTCCPRIRGRQALNDLLVQLEHDRRGELKNLAERGAVSKFTQRGRIQVKLIYGSDTYKVPVFFF